MKKVVFLCILLLSVSMMAQTSSELLGKWKLAEWDIEGDKQDIAAYFETEEVYQIFSADGKFESLIGDEKHNGKWKLSHNNSRLKITTGVLPMNFDVNHFDPKTRIVTHKLLGTFRYEKVSN